MNIDLTQVLIAFITLLGTIVSAVAVPLLKTKLDKQQLSNLEAWVRIGVAAAEQVFTKEEREEKKAFVVDFLHAKGLKFNEQDVDKAIEAEVLRLHNALNQ